MSKFEADKSLRSHQWSQRTHALERLAERYGIVATTAEYDKLLKSIRSGECEKLGKQLDESKEIVRLFDTNSLQWITAVYDTSTEMISTFLPAGFIIADGVVVSDETVKYVAEEPGLPQPVNTPPLTLSTKDYMAALTLRGEQQKERAQKIEESKDTRIHRLEAALDAERKKIAALQAQLEDTSREHGDGKRSTWLKHVINTHVFPLLRENKFFEAAVMLDGLTSLKNGEIGSDLAFEKIGQLALFQENHWRRYIDAPPHKIYEFTRVTLHHAWDTGNVKDIYSPDAALAKAFEDSTKGFVLEWGVKNFGFGQITFRKDNGKLIVDTEAMDDDFVRQALKFWLKSARFQ